MACPLGVRINRVLLYVGSKFVPHTVQMSVKFHDFERRPYETSSAAAALQNDFKKRYKRAAKGLAAAVAKNGCFALQGKPFDSDKQRCCSGAENFRITICAAKWLQSGFEF